MTLGLIGVPAAVRFGSAASWFGSRRAPTLLALLAILTMGPLIVLSTLSVNSTYAALTDTSNHRLADASALAAAYVNTQMTALTALEDSYAHRPTLIAALQDGNHVNYDATAVLAVMKDLRVVRSGTLLAGILDPAGTFWNNEDPGQPTLIGQSAADRDWYRGAKRTGKAYVSVAFTAALSGAPLVIAIGDPVRADGRYAPNGTVVGMMVVAFQLTETQALFSNFSRNQGVAIEVTDQAGVIVALSGAVPTKLVTDKSAGVAAALKGKSTGDRVSFRGEDDFAAYSPVSSIGWTAVARIPASVALADANRLRGNVLAITIVLLALLAGAIIVLYLVFRDGRAVNLALTGANSSLEQRVRARTADVEASNRELRAANSHKTAFLSNMSHELRTPLNAILGFSELLIDSSRQFPLATRNQFLEQIHSSGKHLLGLINDILDLSKVEAGQMELRLQKVDVSAVVAQVASTVEPLAAQKQIHIEIETANAGQILADESKVRQMILNLVSNAIKFSPEGGRVTVRTARVADRLEIVVADNGIGVAKEDLPLLFREFQQIDSGVNRKQQGTGLGLTLTRSFAILHGGGVRVQSELGVGSTFTIDLPIEARSPGRVVRPADPDLNSTGGDPSRPLVLVVDDDPVAAELLTRQLERAGFRSDIARTGEEAITKARESVPVAITLDILLPDQDGWEVLKRLKLDDVTSGIPVIVISVVDDAPLAMSLGAVDYFVKPVDPNELVNRLSELDLKGNVGEERRRERVDEVVLAR
jgi:signal transduction histidine kinase/CheY-like chemotaxis protein